MENIPTVKKHVAGLAAQVAALQNTLQPTVHGVSPETLTPMERAEHYALLSYALNSTLFAYLKSTGVDTKSHPIMLELERIKSILAKIKRVQEGGSSATNDKPDRRVDTGVAQRIIKHSVGRKTVFKDGEKGSAVKADNYLSKLAKENEKRIEAQNNTVTVSDGDEHEAETAKPDKKRKKSKKDSSAKKPKK